jgi:hypothetical protein
MSVVVHVIDQASPCDPDRMNDIAPPGVIPTEGAKRSSGGIREK